MVKFTVLCTKSIALALVALSLTSCHTHIDLNSGIDGNGKVKTQTRPAAGNFSKIDVSRGINVTLEQATNYLVEVEADENLQEHITTKIENGTLYISTNENIDESTAKSVHVKLPTLTSIETTSGSTVSTKTTFTGTNISVKTSSGSDANVALEIDNISCESTSGSSLAVSGKALVLKTSSSSGSTLDARKLMVNDVTAEATSGSNTTVHAINSLNGDASSGSAINYIGEPKTLTKNESSGGNVMKQ